MQETKVFSGTYQIKLSDSNILVDTRDGAATLILPNIANLLAYLQKSSGANPVTISIYDDGGFATINNITIIASTGDTLNNGSTSIVLNTNNGSLISFVVSDESWNVVPSIFGGGATGATGSTGAAGATGATGGGGSGELKLIKFTKTYQDWQSSGTNPNTNVSTLILGLTPTGAVPTSIKIKPSQDFAQGVTSGSGILQVFDGNGIAINNIPCDVSQVSNTSGLYSPALGNQTVIPSQTTPYNILGTLTLNKSGMTINDLTQGSVDIWLWYTIGV